MGDTRQNAQLPLLLRLKDFSGGLNTKSFPTEINDNQMVQLKNCHVSNPGIITKREGTTSFGATLGSGRIVGAVDFRSDDGVIHNLVAATGDEVHSIDSAGSTALRATFATSDQETEILQALNKLYVSNGTDDPIILDTSYAITQPSSAGVTVAPKFTTAVYAQNRILVNDVDNKTHVHFTPPLADDYDKGVNTFKFSEGSGDTEIVKLFQFRSDEILVFMNNRLEELVITGTTPLSDWTRRVIDERVGCVAKKSVAEIGGTVFWLDQDFRVRALNRTALDATKGTQAKPISDAIEDQLKRINTLNASKCSAGIFDDFYMLSVPLDTATEPDNMFVWDVVRGSWSGPWSIPATHFIESDIESAENRLYVGRSDTGRLLQAFDGTTDDDSSSYEVITEFKRYNFQRPESNKTPNELETLLDGISAGTLLVEAKMSGTALYSTISSADLVGGGPALPITLPIQLGSAGIIRDKFHLEQDAAGVNLGPGRNIQFRLKHDETTDFRLIGLNVTVRDENYERENI